MSTARRDGGVGLDRSAPSGRHVAPPGWGQGAVTVAVPRAAQARGRRAVRDPFADPSGAPPPSADRVVDVADAAPDARPDVRSDTRPDRAAGVVRALLRSAVALQAEDLLRTIGALAVAAQRSEGTAASVDWIGWVERDVRDLGHLARAALEVGASLPAGLDVGGGDPARPESIIEGLLAGHEAVLEVLRHLDAVGGDEPWNGVVSRIAARREAEAAALRVTVGDDAPREPERLHVGRSPDQHFSPDLLV
jgi:hypothetical protein